MAIVTNTKGTSRNNFKIGKNGAQLKKSSGTRMSVRDDLDTALANMEGADPLAAQDFVTRQYGEDTYADLDVVTGIVHISGTTRTSYATIALALAAASSGDVVTCGPGTYAESITIPTGVTLQSDYGFEVTKISGAAATGNRVTLNAQSKFKGFEVELPTDATAAISYSGVGLAYILDCELEGKGSSGIGIHQSGATGALDIDNVRYESGDCGQLLQCSAGILQATRVLALGGTITDYAKVTGGVLGLSSCLVGQSATVTDCVEIGAGRLILQNSRFRAGNVGFHITSNSAIVEGIGAAIEDIVTTHISADGGLTTPEVLVTGGELRTDKITGPGAWLSSDNLVIQGADRKAGDKRYSIRSELEVGSPEKGFESVFGEGDSYTRGMVVITSDGTATGTTEGGNLTDVSGDAASSSGSTFSFQGTAANHCIYVGSSLDDASDVLKFWGIKSKQTTAAVEVTAKSFVFELWNGSAWVDFNTMATESSLYYAYADEVFIRANSSEHIRFGLARDGSFIDGPGGATQTWTKKTISGDNLFWIRIRIDTAVTTAPVFEQFKLSTNRSEINADGTHTFHGSSRFAQSLFTGGNTFGESGGVGAASFTVGSGGGETGWTHPVKNSNLTSTADRLYYQMTLPKGIDTSKGVFLDMHFDVNNEGAGEDAIISCSFLPTEVIGVEEADPTGGITPVLRSNANTEERTDKAAQVQTVTGFTTSENLKVIKIRFGPYDISDYYEDDVAFIRFGMTDTGTANIQSQIISIQLSASKWTHGERV